MRTMFFLLVFVAVFSFPVHAQEGGDSNKQPGIMHVVTFLNADCESKEPGVHFEMDDEKMVGKCLDANGRMLEERFVDEHNNSVFRKYQDGRLISEQILTEQEIMQEVGQFQSNPDEGELEKPDADH